MNIIRLYNQNRKQVFKVIFIIASIILAIHFLNYLVGRENNQNLSNVVNSSSTGSTTTVNNPQQSAISSLTVSDKEYKIHSELIDNFIKYCNEGNVSSAYDLLSNSCKEIMFPTLEYFKNNYQKIIFSEERIYTIKNWTGSTYKISLAENLLATGKSNNGIVTEDYFTIVNEEGTDKLNINSFIERTNLNKRILKNNIEIETVYMDIYMDYVIYTLKVNNNTNKFIVLDSGETTQNMYIIDNNGVKYFAARNEITNTELKVQPHSNKEIQVKYLSANISTKKIKSLVFNDIILDFNLYEKNAVKENYKDRINLEIEL